jgi:hypothetical protein
LESLGYVLIYFLKGSLPWQGLQSNNKYDKYTLIYKKKLATPLTTLCEGLPEEFLTYLKYCRSLEFESDPDYKYLKKLFRSLLKQLNYENDKKFDWMIEE